MADNRRVKKSIKQLQRIKTWQLVILLILMILVAATLLRLNNVGMIERRTAVLEADKSGNDDDIKNNLFALQRWSTSRMNASTGAFYLENSYERAVKKAIKVASEDGVTKTTASVRAKIDATCQKQWPGYGVGYSQCYVAGLNKYLPAHDSAASVLKLPNPLLYRQSFVSPLWSPDFAGWAVIICIVIALVILLRIISLLLLKALLRRHYSSI